MIQWIQSVRALIVISSHNARAFGSAASAFRRSAGTVGSSASDPSSSVTSSPESAPAALLNFWFTLSQWLFWPSGSSVARKEMPLIVPSTVVMPREGSFALASFGRVRKVHESAFAGAAGRKSFAVKRILEAVFFIFGWYHRWHCVSSGHALRPEWSIDRQSSVRAICARRIDQKGNSESRLRVRQEEYEASPPVAKALAGHPSPQQVRPEHL